MVFNRFIRSASCSLNCVPRVFLSDPFFFLRRDVGFDSAADATGATEDHDADPGGGAHALPGGVTPVLRGEQPASGRARNVRKARKGRSRSPMGVPFRGARELARSVGQKAAFVPSCRFRRPSAKARRAASPEAGACVASLRGRRRVVRPGRTTGETALLSRAGASLVASQPYHPAKSLQLVSHRH